MFTEDYLLDTHTLKSQDLWSSKKRTRCRLKDVDTSGGKSAWIVEDVEDSLGHNPS